MVPAWSGARAWGLALALLGASGLVAGTELPDLPDLVKRLEHVATESGSGGGGLWIHEGIAYASSLGRGFAVVDVRNPADPVTLSTLPLYTRDADVMLLGSRIIAVAASGGPMRFIDVTDPTKATLLSSVSVPTHNLAVVPGTSLVYASRGGGGGSSIAIDIVDAAVPEAPRIVKVWRSPTSFQGTAVKSGSCHDIHASVEVHRAYCAGGRQSAILDIADPLEPKLLGLIDNINVAYHHWLVPSEDHQLVMLGDEDFGFGSRLAELPNCIATPLGQPSLPQGALWFYSIADPAHPVLLSWVTPLDMSGSTCTVHFGQVIPGTKTIAAGWYHGGVTLIDYTLPVAPRILDTYYQDVNAWDVRYSDGHLFTGDIGRGMDVLRIADLAELLPPLG